MYRKKKRGTPTSTSDEKSSLSGSTTSLYSNENLHNNNKIYLKSIDKELNSGYDMCSMPLSPSGGISPRKTPSGGELWADVVSSGGSFWKDECVEGMEAIEPKVETSPSRRSSDSWEKVQFFIFQVIFLAKYSSLKTRIDPKETNNSLSNTLHHFKGVIQHDSYFHCPVFSQVNHVTQLYETEKYYCKEPNFTCCCQPVILQIDYTPDMLIEVDEECLFQNKQFSLQFDSDVLDGTSVASSTTNEKQKLIVQDVEGNQAGSLPEKIARKIKHSFTKEYISDRAEKLRKYTERLLREAVAMERNPTIADLLNEYA